MSTEPPLNFNSRRDIAACLGTRSNKVMSPATLPNNHAALPVCAAVPVFG